MVCIEPAKTFGGSLIFFTTTATIKFGIKDFAVLMNNRKIVTIFGLPSCFATGIRKATYFIYIAFKQIPE